MRKNNGFTLIEVLAVIILLGLVVAIVYPNIKGTINDAKDDLYEDQVKNIIDGAKGFIADNPYDIPANNNDEITLSLCQLKFGSYVNIKISNPKTNQMFDCATKIKIKNVNDTYQYSIDFDGTTEEPIPDRLIYPAIKLVGGALEYINLNGWYDVSNIYVDNVLLSSDNDAYEVHITSDLGLSGYADMVGTYVVKYEIITKSTGVKTVLYKTIIVVDDVL